MLQTVIIEMYTSYNLKLPCIQLRKLLPQLLGLMQCHVPIYLHIYKFGVPNIGILCAHTSLYTIAMMWCYAFYQCTCNIQLIFKLLVPNLHTSLAVHCEAMSLYMNSDVHYKQTHVHIP